MIKSPYIDIPIIIVSLTGSDTGYPHDGRADKYSYPHDGRADKDSYPHDGRADKDSYPHDCRADKDSYPHDRHNLYIMLSLYLWLNKI